MPTAVIVRATVAGISTTLTSPIAIPALRKLPDLYRTRSGSQLCAVRGRVQATGADEGQACARALGVEPVLKVPEFRANQVSGPTYVFGAYCVSAARIGLRRRGRPPEPATLHFDEACAICRAPRPSTHAFVSLPRHLGAAARFGHKWRCNGQSACSERDIRPVRSLREARLDPGDWSLPYAWVRHGVDSRACIAGGAVAGVPPSCLLHGKGGVPLRGLSGPRPTGVSGLDLRTGDPGTHIPAPDSPPARRRARSAVPTASSLILGSSRANASIVRRYGAAARLATTHARHERAPVRRPSSGPPSGRCLGAALHPIDF